MTELKTISTLALETRVEEVYHADDKTISIYSKDRSILSKIANAFSTDGLVVQYDGNSTLKVSL